MSWVFPFFYSFLYTSSTAQIPRVFLLDSVKSCVSGWRKISPVNTSIFEACQNIRFAIWSTPNGEILPGTCGDPVNTFIYPYIEAGPWIDRTYWHLVCQKHSTPFEKASKKRHSRHAVFRFRFRYRTCLYACQISGDEYQVIFSICSIGTPKCMKLIVSWHCLLVTNDAFCFLSVSNKIDVI